MDRLDLWSSRVSIWLYRFGVFGTLPALLLLVTVDVLARYLLNAPLQWSRDANGLLLLMTLFSALPHAWDRNHHVRMEIVYVRLRKRWRRFADTLSALAGSVFSLMIAVQGARFAAYMLATDETGENLALPLWPFMVFMAACALVLAARLIANPRADDRRTQSQERRWT